MDDLISREAAIDALGECPYNWNDWPEEIQAVNDWQDAIESIKNVPAVDAAPVAHGKWIEKRYTQPIGDDRHVNVVSYFCSACNGEHYYGGVNYCPNCGAKMDGERE